MTLSNDLKCTQDAQWMITAVVPNSGQYHLVDVSTAGLIDDGSLMAAQQVQSNLITILVCENDSIIEALTDSSALHNFVSKLLV